MGHRAERVRHQIQAKDIGQRVGFGIFHHGIHPFKYLDEAYRNYSISARLAHLEVVRRWGRQFLRKRGRSDSNLPDGIDVEYALRFGFQASNNGAEYEAVIVGFNLAHSIEADQLEVCSDS